ncbi:MAG: hypothetical protein J6C97_05220 [Clostridia bacterium]|nr:hypothetical protein [Clostridia bacterium]
MKKFLKVFSNLLWIIFIGIWSVISCAIVGASYCVTILGIPFGLRYFKMIKLVFAPFGKKVETHFGKKGFLNVIWLIFGGLETVFVFGFIGVICFITIIGIPLGKQVFKIAKYFWAPFGAEIIILTPEQIAEEERIKQEKLFEKRKTAYDNGHNKLKHQLELLDRINANPNVEITINDTTTTVKDYITNNEELILKERKLLKNNIILTTLLVFFAIPITLFIFYCFSLVSNNLLNNISDTFLYVFIALSLIISIVGSFVICHTLKHFLFYKKLNKLFIEHYNFLYDYYTYESKEIKLYGIKTGFIIHKTYTDALIENFNNPTCEDNSNNNTLLENTNAEEN